MLTRALSTRQTLHLIAGSPFEIRGTTLRAICGATPGHGGWITSFCGARSECTECTKHRTPNTDCPTLDIAPQTSSRTQ